MNGELLNKLRDWRSEQARREDVELYRVFSNATIEAIAAAAPKTKEELLKIKGIKDRKCEKYGLAILSMTSGETPAEIGKTESEESVEKEEAGERVFAVSAFLGLLNIGLRRSAAKVRGEVSSFQMRGGHAYFSISDKDGSVMHCFMWSNDYRISGISIAEGLEIVVSGYPEIYKPSGKLSFRTRTIELAGEGALKKAYDKLKAMLEREGLFAPERKKEMPEFPHRIGLVTSRDGAVIHDFLNNIGRFGFKITFIDSRVEGSSAVRELLSAIRYFKTQKTIDALVLIRGGGSLESLQAFNNEYIVREIADCPFPVIVGIGHDKDVPLVSLAADAACSTPTAVAKLLNVSWEQAGAAVRLAEHRILDGFGAALQERIFYIDRTSGVLEDRLREMIERVRRTARRFSESVAILRERIRAAGDSIPATNRRIAGALAFALQAAGEKIALSEKMLAASDPKRQLALGWSIAFSGGKIIRRIADAPAGSLLDVRVSDGTIRTRVAE
ncbi:exodeoxyribonuclease VII large subunit [bacterium]|nr:exodeoxyribonuclease VII large subunit [bacterium]